MLGAFPVTLVGLLSLRQKRGQLVRRLSPQHAPVACRVFG